MTEVLLKDSVCSKCGVKWDEHDRLEITSCGKVLCRACEMACENYRKFMLPNGTHCAAVFEAEYLKYRLLMMHIPTQPSEVKRARKKYENIKSGELFELLAAQAREYKSIQLPAASAAARVELEAIRQVLYDRVQSIDIDRHLFEVFKEIAEGKRQYVKG